MRLPIGTLAWVVLFLAGCAASGRGGDPPGGPDGAVPSDGSADLDSGVDSDASPPADAGPFCGNGVVDPGEACDDGNTDNDDACLDSCVVATCGDGYIQNGVEGCDDGNGVGGDGCDESCQLESCGDGVVQTSLGEECDDGNTSSNDSCLNTCMNNVCGDGHLWIGVEGCDDGNSSSGDGCTTGCVVEYCGDGVIQAGIGEECEGGSPGQTCTTTCGSSGTQTCQAATCTWTACTPPSETCNAADDDCDGDIDTVSCLVDVWRFYNPGTGDHMYKTSQIPDAGYQLETNHFKVYTSAVPGTVPLYQRFNGTDHLPTYDPDEASPTYFGTVTLGYVATSGSWSAAGYPSADLCRYYYSGNGDHMLYTYISNADLPTVLPGWIREGCGRYVWDFH